jgi:hypothetical protein
MSSEVDADIEALTSPAAAATVTQAPAAEPTTDAAPAVAAAATPASPTAAAATAAATAANGEKKDDASATPSTPAKEERKIGKLNLAAFNAPAPSEPAEKPTPKSVGKLAAFQAEKQAEKDAEKPKEVERLKTVGKLGAFQAEKQLESADKPKEVERVKTVGKLGAFQPVVGEDKSAVKDAPRPVGKLGAKMMHIPIFAPGAAPAGEIMRKSSVVDAPTTGPATTESAAVESSAAASSAATPSNRGPGKLQANTLMTNLNAMLGAPAAGPRMPRMSVGEEANPNAPTSASVSNGNANSAAAMEESKETPQEEATPAPTITHVSGAHMPAL